jgi:hypothetical protein
MFGQSLLTASFWQAGSRAEGRGSRYPGATLASGRGHPLTLLAEACRVAEGSRFCVGPGAVEAVCWFCEGVDPMYADGYQFRPTPQVYWQAFHD